MKALREILGEDLYNKGVEETFFLSLMPKVENLWDIQRFLEVDGGQDRYKSDVRIDKTSTVCK